MTLRPASVCLWRLAQNETIRDRRSISGLWTLKVNTSRCFLNQVSMTSLTDFIGQSSVLHAFSMWGGLAYISQGLYVGVNFIMSNGHPQQHLQSTTNHLTLTLFSRSQVLFEILQGQYLRQAQIFTTRVIRQLIYHLCLTPCQLSLNIGGRSL